MLLFARLKLRLLRNALRTPAGLGLVLFAILGTIGGSAAGLAIARTSAENRSLLLPILAAVLTLGWTAGPMLFGASDETIDTTRLALYPLNSGRLAVGMSLAAVIGPGPLTAALVVGGGVLASAMHPLSLPLAILAAALIVAIAATSSKLVLTALGSALRRRRSRDLATIATGLGVAVVGLSLQAVSSFGPTIDRTTVERVVDVVRWLPIAWPGDALARAGRGELLIPAIELVASMALLGFIIRSWGRQLARSLTEVTEHAEAETIDGPSLPVRFARTLAGRLRGHETIDAEGPLGQSVVERPVSIIRLILAKELRYFHRHPRYRVQVVSQATVLLVGGAPFVGAIVQRNPQAVLFGCIPGLTAGVTGSNLLGPDGRSLWAEWIVLPSLRPVLRGRSIAFAALGLAGAVALTLGAAIWTGGWQFVPAALGASVGMALTGSGVGAFTSVVAPTPFPEDGSPNPFATTSPGAGCLTAVMTMAGVVTGLVLAAPILVGLALTRDSTTIGLLLAVAAPLYGSAIWRFTTHRAAQRADRTAPDLIALLA